MGTSETLDLILARCTAITREVEWRAEESEWRANAAQVQAFVSRWSTQNPDNDVVPVADEQSGVRTVRPPAFISKAA
jgi:hypothetical protein